MPTREGCGARYHHSIPKDGFSFEDQAFITPKLSKLLELTLQRLMEMKAAPPPPHSPCQKPSTLHDPGHVNNNHRQAMRARQTR